MADKIVPNPNDNGVLEKFTDMGDGTWRLNVIANAAAITAGAAGYPSGATPVASSTVVAAAVANVSLPAAVGKTTYISGLDISGAGATAASRITAALSGVLGGTISYVIAVSAPADGWVQPISVQFNPPLPASAVNTAISLSVPSFGAGNTAVGVSVRGFQL